MFRPAKKRLRSRIRPLATLATAAAIAVCALGIPLPLQGEKQITQPYPCMNSPCGCKSADYCWKNCCCHTRAEKLAWARDNGVTPPAYVLAAVEVPAVAKQSSCCCKKKATKTCCSKPAKSKCCGSNDRQCREKSSTVLVFQALRCQGLTSSLTALPPTVMPSQVLQPLAAPSCERTNLADDLLAPGPLAVPDTPPPQFA